jgi:serine/threonine-protein kinase
MYMHDGTLFAAPFNLDRLQVTGPPVPAFDGIASEVRSGAAQFAVSGNGILAYMPKHDAGLDAPISWLYPTGKIVPLRPTAARWSNPRFSPDGRRLAIDMGERASLDVWVYEWMRDSLSRLTSDPGEDRKPVWTPDGQRIVFASARGDGSTLNLYWQRADGTGSVQRLTESKNQQWPASWHPSGRFLAFQELNLQTGADLMILPMEGDEASGWKPGKATVFLNGPVGEREPMFSPDGRWLAYDSIESGTREVYVRPFPGPGGKWQISTGGGEDATWSRARPELFYETPEQRIMAVPYSVQGHTFLAEKPQLWSEVGLLLRPRQRSFDLHPDGDRLALATVPESQTAVKGDKLVLIFDFFDELRRIAPARR